MAGRNRPTPISLLALVSAVAFGCAAPFPSLPATTATLPPPAPVTPTAEPSPTLAASLAHYSADGFAIEYPADWMTIAENEFAPADHVFVVLGHGEWQNGCMNNDDVTVCTGTVLTPEPGEVLVSLSSRAMGPADPIYGPPPFESTFTDSGLAVSSSDAGQYTRATVYLPGRRQLEIDVRYGGPPTDGNREEVRRVIDSITYRHSRVPPQMRTWNETPDSDCDATLQGRLGRGAFGLSVMPVDSTFLFASWPAGWTAAIGTDGRAELLDSDGRLVAREWDEISMAGHETRTDEFRVCRSTVTVVRPFPD